MTRGRRIGLAVVATLARAAAPNPTAAAHGIVDDRLYRACLVSRGWVREQHPEPPPPGWYRGFE